MDLNPYASPKLAADEADPGAQGEELSIPEELRQLGDYSRIVVRILLLQIPLILIGLAGLFCEVPPTLAGIFFVGVMISNVALAASVFMLSRLIFGRAFPWPRSLFLAFLSLTFPIGFAPALVPLLRAAWRYEQFGVPFGWLGPDPDKLEARLREWPGLFVARDAKAPVP